MIFQFNPDQREAAEKLLADARACVGSDGVGALEETADGFAVTLLPVWTSNAFFDLPSMVVDKVFVPPEPLKIEAAKPVKAAATLA